MSSWSNRFKMQAAFVVLGSITLAFQNCSNSMDLSSQPARPLSQSEVLTSELINKSASGSESEHLSLAETRQKLLIAKLKQDPAEVLRQGISPEARAEFSERVQASIEKSVEVEGELVVLHVHDDKDPKKSHYEYEVHGKFGEVHALHFAREMKRDILTGEKVRVNGLELVEEKASGKKKKHLVVDSSDEDILILGAENGPTYGTAPGVQPNTFGEQRTLVMMVNFQDAPSNKPWTSADMQALFTGKISPFYREVSYGQTWFTATVFGWQTIATSSTSCDRSAITNLADQAVIAAGYNFAAYDRLIYIWPPNNNCGFGGLGTVGGKPSRTYVNGSFGELTFTHELGHNLGLFHANILKCPGTTLGTNCTVGEYGDLADTMGGGQGHFNAYQHVSSRRRNNLQFLYF